MNIGGCSRFEERDEIRKLICERILNEIRNSFNYEIDAVPAHRLEVVRLIELSYPLNLDLDLVPELSEALNSLFSSICDSNQIDKRADAQLILDVAGPELPNSGVLCGAYINSLLNSSVQEKVLRIYNRQ